MDHRWQDVDHGTDEARAIAARRARAGLYFPDALAISWGAQAAGGGFLPRASLVRRLRGVLNTQCRRIIPALLGATPDADGVLEGGFPRPRRESDGDGIGPIFVTVSVDLSRCRWNTSDGDRGSDMYSFIEWLWPPLEGGLSVEDRLFAHLGAAAMEVLLRNEPW